MAAVAATASSVVATLKVRRTSAVAAIPALEEEAVTPSVVEAIASVVVEAVTASAGEDTAPAEAVTVAEAIIAKQQGERAA